MNPQFKIEASEIPNASYKHLHSIADDAKHRTAGHINNSATPRAARVAALSHEIVDIADVMPTARQIATTVAILSVALELTRLETEEAGQLAAQYWLEMQRDHDLEEMNEPLTLRGG